MNIIRELIGGILQVMGCGTLMFAIFVLSAMLESDMIGWIGFIALFLMCIMGACGMLALGNIIEGKEK